MRGFCDGSYFMPSDDAPAKAGVGGLIEVEIFAKSERSLFRAKIAQFPIQVQPEISWSFDSERRALEVLLDLVGYFFQEILQANAA